MKRLCGLQVDDQLELARLNNWQVGRLVALENSRRVIADLAISVSEVGSVAQQPPGHGIFAQFVHCRHAVMGGERDELLPSAIKKRIGSDQQGRGRQASHGPERGVNVSLAACVQYVDFLADGARCLLKVSRLKVETRIA